VFRRRARGGASSPPSFFCTVSRWESPQLSLQYRPCLISLCEKIGLIRWFIHDLLDKGAETTIGCLYESLMPNAKRYGQVRPGRSCFEWILIQNDRMLNALSSQTIRSIRFSHGDAQLAIPPTAKRGKGDLINGVRSAPIFVWSLGDAMLCHCFFRSVTR
jgi:hypothetical protein